MRIFNHFTQYFVTYTAKTSYIRETAIYCSSLKLASLLCTIINNHLNCKLPTYFHAAHFTTAHPTYGNKTLRFVAYVITNCSKIL